MPKHPYDLLKEISDRVYEKQAKGEVISGWSNDVLLILYSKGIKLRQDDGELIKMNFSVAKSEKNCLVVGLEYAKRDGSISEDTFAFRKGNPHIDKYYKGKIEKALTEYKGTHKKFPTPYRQTNK